MELTITMKLDNAAMTEGEDGVTPDGRAVADILRNLADQLEDGVPMGTSRRIKDANGTQIGQWTTITD
jgi:hypothetical protein